MQNVKIKYLKLIIESDAKTKFLKYQMYFYDIYDLKIEFYFHIFKFIMYLRVSLKSSQKII